MADVTPGPLDTVIDKILTDDPQLKRDLDESGYEEGEIYAELAGQYDGIEEVVVTEQRELATAVRDMDERQQMATKEVGEPPTPGQRAASVDGWIGFGIFYCIGIAIWGIVRLFGGWLSAHNPLDWRSWMEPLGWVLPAVLWFAVLTRIARQRTRDGAVQQADFERRKAQWDANHAEIAAKLSIGPLAQRIAALEQKIDTLRLERTRQAMIAAINRRRAPSYDAILDIRKPRGFGEVFDKRFTIVTPARRRLEFMLRSMPGGSIGIAGSRGAGKTTLLKMFCGPKRIIEKLNDKPVLGVLVSAPVAYEARDFILYLFSTVCQNVIEAEGGSYTFPGAPVDEPPAELLDSAGIRLLRPLPRFLFNVGAGLIAVGALLAVLLAVPTTETKEPPANTPAATTRSVQGGSAGSNAAAASGAPSARPAPSPNDDATPAAADLMRGPGALFAQRLLAQLKIDPATWLGWGISLVAAALFLAEIIGDGAWWLFVSSVAFLLLRLPPWINPARTLIAGYLHRHGPVAYRDLQVGMPVTEDITAGPPSTRTQAAAAASRTPAESLRGQAQERLRAIKFQQTFTSGWSGALKMPLGIEGGVNKAVTLAQNQLSLPELVALLAKFLEEASLKYQVIIGIDELDKLATDTLAQQFLNDIKSIFGLERCFYLISVSEDAMSSFERRGLPFRDVFDSSFDDFVYVDHLGFTSAQELLQQRVVGRPIPFFGLSYCMSGGLARDLIRNFRGVLELQDAITANNGLGRLCNTLVTSDLRAKIRAVITSARKLGADEEVDAFIETLFELESRVGNDQDLISRTVQLLMPVRPIGLPPSLDLNSSPGGPRSRDEQTVTVREQLAELQDEIATYLLYAVTIRRFFTDGITQAMLTVPDGPGSLDTLARARQLLGVNPRITRALLRGFTVAHALPPLPVESQTAAT